MSFEDNEEINEYAYEAMESMYKAGVINGIDEQHVSPKSFATRAQMVKMAYLSDKQKDIDACKDFLVRFLSDIERGANISEMEMQRFSERYNQYINKYKQNGYIQDKVNKFKEKGLL